MRKIWLTDFKDDGGNSDNAGKITSWNLSGRWSDNTEFINIHTNNITLGSTVQEFLIDADWSVSSTRSFKRKLKEFLLHAGQID